MASRGWVSQLWLPPLKKSVAVGLRFYLSKQPRTLPPLVESIFLRLGLFPQKLEAFAAVWHFYAKLHENVSHDPRSIFDGPHYLKSHSTSLMDRAFLQALETYAIPKKCIEAALEGARWDVEKRAYSSLSDLLAYAARIWGTKAMMLTAILGQRSPIILARSFELGLAIELTRVVEDFDEDVANGRLYLPLQWLKEEGLNKEEALTCSSHFPPIKAVLERLLNTSDELFSRAKQGLPLLKLLYRPFVFALCSAYQDKIRSLGEKARPSTVRALTFIFLDQLLGKSLSRAQGALFIAQACATLIQKPSPVSDPPLDESLFLLDAFQ